MSKKLPTEAQVKNLHKKYAKTDADFALIYTHCQVVDAIAAQLLDAKPNSQIDRDLLHVACMLHDIGAYDVLENGKFVDGVRHGVIGEQILRNEGFPEQIWRFASHHTGVGLTKQDVINQKLVHSASRLYCQHARGAAANVRRQISFQKQTAQRAAIFLHV